MQPEITAVNLADIADEVVLRGRVNDIRRKRFPLDSGLPGVNLEFGHTLIPDGYFTPRHRHNFDQIRLTLSGTFSTGHGDLAAGECGYFPEGASYGPQDQKGDCHSLVLQFQGPCGEHFMSNEEANETYQKLLAQGGTFQGGFYTARKPDGGKINKDSSAAIYEEFVGKKLVLPEPRYRTPIMMMPDAFRWMPSRKHAGLDTKHLGTFSEVQTGVGFLRLHQGARIPSQIQENAEIRYVISGSVDFRGKRWDEDSYFFIPAGASVGDLVASETAVMFTISLPMLAEIARDRQQSNQAA
jgi:hypothetical protein